MKPIASDYDGTYDSHPELRGETDFIITGNSWNEYDEIDEEMSDDRKPIFFNPVDPKDDVMKVVAHKAEIINKTQASKFYEDQEMQVNLLKALCPNCRVVLVKPNTFSI